jgi:hypothetical protein
MKNNRLVICLVALVGCGDDIAGATEGASGTGDSGDTEPTGGAPQLGVKLEWSWTANEVSVLPLVADIAGDDRPEVIVNASRTDGIAREIGEIVVLDGVTGTELWRTKETPQGDSHGSFGLGTPAVGDLDGDLRPDIVYPGRVSGFPEKKRGPVHAVDGAGKHLWTGHTADNTPVLVDWQHGAAALVNLDDDSAAEVAIGGVLFDNDGLLVWNQGGNGGTLGTPTANNNPPDLLYSGSLATFADLTGDGRPELLTGREAWTITWTPGSPPAVSMSMLWKNSDGEGNDGWPALGDLDQDGAPEVVLVAWPDIKVLDGKTGKLWCGVDPTGTMCADNDALRTPPIEIAGGNLGGPATIADFDGDGRPEVGIAAGKAYAVYDFARPGEELIFPDNAPSPAPGAMFLRWSTPTQDNSSGSNGSSVFDFQGDGVPEVLYHDECKLRIYDGSTGQTRHEELSSSGTVHEYPPVVDVDGDGHAEFLAVSNLSEPVVNAQCQSADPAFVPRQGVFAYGADGEPWAATRKLWTQHTYHVTNAHADGNVPMTEQPNWTVPGLNNFRQNVAGD